MRILALPHDRNPYQRLLYEQFTRRGHEVRYAGELTPSHTLNVLLLPLELAARRAAGWDILHIHWLFAFKLTGSEHFWVIRRAARAWFTLVLIAARGLGLRIVWTAHNVLPHDRLFDDDLSARRALAARSDLVVTHSKATLTDLERLGIVPRRTVVAPMGTFTPDVDLVSMAASGTHAPPRMFLFFGQVAEYKGLEDLLEAFFQVPDRPPVRLVIAGECRDSRLRHRLLGLATAQPDRVQVRFHRLTDTELTELLGEADVVVLPYRRVTTSASALSALGHGRPVVLPDLPALAELPDSAVLRYDGSLDGLARAITWLGRAAPEELSAMGAAGARYARGLRWEDTAAAMLEGLDSV
jgi:glycosyltransferase involved in cell wall biosynthesis